MFFRNLAVALMGLSLISCARLYHVQFGSFDNTLQATQRFEIMLSETGINTEEAAQLARAFTRKGSQEDKNIQQIQQIIALFQMGPSTGSPVYNEHYATLLIERIYERCPTGRVTGLTSIREQRKYPVISGEIVKLVGYCQSR